LSRSMGPAVGAVIGSPALDRQSGTPAARVTVLENAAAARKRPQRSMPGAA
jgi:hypothetical protein